MSIKSETFDGPAELHSARFTSIIEIKDKKSIIKAYQDALAPEAESGLGRASYKLKINKDKLIIEITAEDATAFRAVMTSLTGLMSLVDKALKIAEK